MANAAGYLIDGATTIALGDSARVSPRHENKPIMFGAWDRAELVILQHGRNLNTIEVEGTAFRYTQGDAEQYLYQLLLALSETGLADLYAGESGAATKYPDCWWVSGEGEAVSGQDEGDERSYVTFRLTFIQSAAQKTCALTTDATVPTQHAEYAGRTSEKVYSWGGTALGLLSGAGLKISCSRDPVIVEVPRCYGVRILDRTTGRQGRTMKIELTVTPDPITYPTRQALEQWFYERINNIGDAPAILTGSGNTWDQCHLVDVDGLGTGDWTHYDPDNIRFSFLLEAQDTMTTDHSLLTNLDFTHAGHTDFVSTNTEQTISAKKTFSVFPETPSAAPTTNYQVANKKYVDDLISGLSSVYAGIGHNHSELYAPVSHSHTLADISDAGSAAGYDYEDFEPALGVPAEDDYVLSSKKTGERAWVPSGGGGGASNLYELNDVSVPQPPGEPDNLDLLQYDAEANGWKNRSIAGAGIEPALGNPESDGYVLSSTSGGVRSWVAPGGAPTAHAATHTNGTDDIQSATATQKGLMTATYAEKLDGIEVGADVTDATNVNAAGAVMESDYDANTILAANSDNTPVAVTIAEQTIVGRITGGNIAALTATQVRTLINVADGADVTNSSNVDAAGATMNSDTSLAGNGYFLDEDNMASDSDTKVPSQQSVKAYVDAHAGTGKAHYGGYSNLRVKYVSATSVDVDADSVVLNDGSNNRYEARSVDLTIAITTSGANGLDTGSEAANTWYFIWVIYNGSTVAGLLSTSATSPTMPSGYTYKKRVGAVRNDGSSNFRAFYQLDDMVYYATPQSAVSASASSDAWAALDCSAYLPSTYGLVGGMWGIDATDSATQRSLSVATDNSGSYQVVWRGYSSGTLWQGWAAADAGWSLPNAGNGTTFYWMTNSASNRYGIRINWYKDMI